MAERVGILRIALGGLSHLLRTERSAKWHLLATVCAGIAGLLLRLSIDQWRWIVLAAALIWAGEAFNTAFERLGDAITLDHHPEIGRAKDVAAAGVMICIVAGSVIVLSVFLPAIADRLWR